MLHDAIPSRIGYIIFMLILTVLPSPCSRCTFLTMSLARDKLSSIVSFFLHYMMESELVSHPRFHWLLALPLHLLWSSYWSITSSWKLSTKCVMNIATFWLLPIGQSNSWWKVPSLSLDNLCCPRQHPCLSSDANAFKFCVVPWVACYPADVMFYLGVLPSFMSRISWESHHLLWILDIAMFLAITIHFVVPVLFLIGIPTNELWCANSKLLATLLLWS